MRGLLLFAISTLITIPGISHADAIHDAAKKGDVAAITAALDAGAGINESDGRAVALVFAVRNGHVAAAKLLVERGADVNAPSRWGPALMPAVAKRKTELVILLLKSGADPNAMLEGEAAIHVAVKTGCFDCVKALVDAGANVNAKTKDGKTPLHLARFHEQGEIADYLLAHGVVVPAPAPISTKLAIADVEKGGAAFAVDCAGCHNFAPEGGAKIGPNLWGVVGRDKASIPGKTYSKALQVWDGVWTFEDLNKYLYGPMLTTPGVYMETLGVPDETERVNMIAYLRTLSDNPIPLPRTVLPSIRCRLLRSC
jgi:cytochrome c